MTINSDDEVPDDDDETSDEEEQTYFNAKNARKNKAQAKAAKQKAKKAAAKKKELPESEINNEFVFDDGSFLSQGGDELYMALLTLIEKKVREQLLKT